MGAVWLTMALTNKFPIASIPNTMALAAFEMSGLARPPTPKPFNAPHMPGHVNAAQASRKAQKIVDLCHSTGIFSSPQISHNILSVIAVCHWISSL